MVATVAQDNGAKGVFFHGRSCSQGYSGKADYEPIREAKKALKIPVIRSGDVLSPELAKDMLDKTNCDGVLVARGAFGTPWIFEQTEKYLKDPSIPPCLPYSKRAREAISMSKSFDEIIRVLDKLKSDYDVK